MNKGGQEPMNDVAPDGSPVEIYDDCRPATFHN
jgi:hypothetical protein